MMRLLLTVAFYKIKEGKRTDIGLPKDIILKTPSHKAAELLTAIMSSTEVYAEEYIDLNLRKAYVGVEEGITIPEFIAMYWQGMFSRISDTDRPKLVKLLRSGASYKDGIKSAVPYFIERVKPELAQLLKKETLKT